MKLLAALFVLFVLAAPIVPLLSDSVGTVSAESLPVWTRVFHLHDGSRYQAGQYDWLNSTGPNNPPYNDYDGDGIEGVTIRKNVPPQRWHHWILYPSTDSAVKITGDLSAYVWARSRDNESGSLITAIFFDILPSQFSSPNSGTEIGRVTIPMQGPAYSVFKLYNLTISGLSYTLPAGHHLVLTLQRGDALNDGLIIHFDKDDYDSYVVLRTSTFISVNALDAEDEAGDPRDVFSESESVTVLANVSNPFGAYDIISASASAAYQSNGSVFFGPSSMALASSGPSPTPYWKLFNTVIPNIPPASFVVNVSAYDAQGTPSWMTKNITVVRVDHFGVAAPPTVTVEQNFSLTISALNETNEIITNWVGVVELMAYRTDRVTKSLGGLSITTVTLTPSDGGQISLSNQTYDFAEETILIRVWLGSNEGWSSAIEVRSGPVVDITVVPPDPEDLACGDPLPLTATGRDAWGHNNTTWTPYWYSVPATGVFSGAGLSVTFRSIHAGSFTIVCRNNETGASCSVEVEVIPSALRSIVIHSPSYPLQIREAQSQALTATGYDKFGNVVDITGAPPEGLWGMALRQHTRPATYLRTA